MSCNIDKVKKYPNRQTKQLNKIGATTTKTGKPVKYLVEGYYEGIKIRVITTATDIITAFPIK